MSAIDDTVRRYRFAFAAVVLSTTNFLMVFDGLVVTVALPSIQQTLDISTLDAQWVATAYSLPLGGLLLLGGRCGDRYGRRRVLITGLIVFMVGLLLATLAPNAELLLAARVLQGAAAALAIPNTYALISSMRSTERRNRLFAAAAVAGSGATAGGAVIGGLVSDALGWRYVFLLSSPVVLAAVFLAPKVLDAGRVDERLPKLDLTGAILSTLGLTALVFAVTNVERAGLLSAATLWSLAVAVVTLVAFAVIEFHITVPLLRPSLFRIRPLRAAIVGMPGQVFAYTGTLYIGLLYFQQVLGYSALQAGLAFAPLGIASALVSPMITKLLRKMHWAAIALPSQVLCAGGMTVLAAAPPDGNYGLYYLPGMVMLGAGIAGAAITLNVAAGSKVPAKDKGVGYGLFETSTHVSGALVVAILATAATSRTRNTDGGQVEALAAGYQFAFAIGAAAAFIAGILTVVIGHRQQDRSRPVAESAASPTPGPEQQPKTS